MIRCLIYGSYTPAAWQAVRRDPDSAPREIRLMTAADGGELVHFFFALEEFDFYAVIEGASPGTLRHRLMAGGSFRRLHADPLQSFAELFPHAASRP